MSNDTLPDLLIRDVAQVITPLSTRRSLPVDGPLQVIPDGAVLLSHGSIAAVGTTGELLRDARAKRAATISAPHSVLAPGFVDSHTHLVFAGTRQEEYEMRLRGVSYEAIAAAGGGIRNSVRRLRAAPEEELFSLAKERCRQFLAYGTTTVEAKSGYGLDLENELKILRVLRRLNEDQEVPLEIVPTFLGAHEVPDEYRNDRAGYIDLLCQTIIPRVTQERLAEFCDVFCETSVFGIQESRRILTMARSHGLKVKLHADQLTRNGGTRLAVELGAISADHLECIQEEDVQLLAESRVVATLLPGAGFHLGSRQSAPARKLIDAGARVALATDFNPGTSPTVNMQAILSLAGSALHMSPAESFAAATLGGALALQRDQSLGSIEVGKQADLVLFDVEDYRLIPYHFGMNHVRMVLKQGKVVVNNSI